MIASPSEDTSNIFDSREPVEATTTDNNSVILVPIVDENGRITGYETQDAPDREEERAAPEEETARIPAVEPVYDRYGNLVGYGYQDVYSRIEEEEYNARRDDFREPTRSTNREIAGVYEPESDDRDTRRSGTLVVSDNMSLDDILNF